MTAHKSGDPLTLNRLYGRSSGHKLRKGQLELVEKLLPDIQVPAEGAITARTLFGEDRPLHFEIGFGSGEHLADRADLLPDHGFIGCEPFLNGMAKLLAVIDQEGLENIRVWDDDITKLLPHLPAGAFRVVSILYPDPWPKRRQRKRRLVSDETLAALARVIAPGGELRFATDIDDYAGWVLARILRSPDFRWRAGGPDDWRRPWAGWPGTRYEAKALREGRVPSYLTFERVTA